MSDYNFIPPIPPILKFAAIAMCILGFLGIYHVGVAVIKFISHLHYIP